jgi:hypothetical protein
MGSRIAAIMAGEPFDRDKQFESWKLPQFAGVAVDLKWR